MGFLNKIMLHLNGAVEKGIDKSNSTMREKLFALLCEMIRAEDGKLVNEQIKEISHDVVYFVLNATDLRNQKRAFVAALNWANLNETVINNALITNEELIQCFTVNEITSGTMPYSIDNFVISEEQKNSIHKSWNVVWHEYFDLTQENDTNENKLLTINHWLLNYVPSPLNIGIYWGATEKDADESYIHLPDITLQKLGISAPILDESQLLKLNRDFTGVIIDDRALQRIKDKFSKMGQDLHGVNNLQNIGFCVYHMLRSYGCWGGRAFYSIPISYGSWKKPSVGVLSICTTKPMNENLVLKWSLIANKVFKDVILSDIEEMKEFENELNSLRDISMSTHAMKTMINGLLNPPLNSLRQDKIFENNLQLDLAIQAKRKILGLAEIINLISKFSFKNSSESIAEKDLEKSGLFSPADEIINLSELLKEINHTRILDKNLAKIIFHNDDKMELPQKFLQYRNIKLNGLFFELYLLTAIENAVAHGTVNRDGMCHIELIYESETNSLVIINEAKETALEKTKMRGNFRLFQIILSKLNIGVFTPIQETRNGKQYFKTTLKSF